jgi:hypothetical protein
MTQVKEGGGEGGSKPMGRVKNRTELDDRMLPTAIRRIIEFLMNIRLSDSPSSDRINLSETAHSDC